MCISLGSYFEFTTEYLRECISQPVQLTSGMHWCALHLEATLDSLPNVFGNALMCIALGIHFEFSTENLRVCIDALHLEATFKSQPNICGCVHCTWKLLWILNRISSGMHWCALQLEATLISQPNIFGNAILNQLTSEMHWCALHLEATLNSQPNVFGNALISKIGTTKHYVAIV